MVRMTAFETASCVWVCPFLCGQIVSGLHTPSDRLTHASITATTHPTRTPRRVPHISHTSHDRPLASRTWTDESVLPPWRVTGPSLLRHTWGLTKDSTKERPATTA